MSTSIVTTVPESKYFVSKHGNVAILSESGDNYIEFKNSIMPALKAAHAWDIVEGTYQRPTRDGKAQQDWDDRCDKAVLLLGSSVASNHRATVMPLLMESKVSQVWKDLSLLNKSSSRIHQGRLLFDFRRETWNIPEPLSVYVARLERYRVRLQDTPNAISEKDLLLQILFSLPLTNSNWQQARHNCEKEGMKLREALTYLESLEPPTLEAPVPLVNFTTDSNRGSYGGRGRGRGRGGRGRGRGNGGNGRIGKTCFFCGKQGHLQKDCFKYKKAKSQLGKGENQAEDQVNLVIGTRSETPSRKASVNTVGKSNIYSGWLLDSGATHHFTSHISDFQSIKRWSTPREVKVANGGVFEALGIGEVQIKTIRGSCILLNVWYAPDLESRLISVGVLDDEGVSVKFGNQKAVAILDKTGQIAFEGTKSSGDLYYIDQSDAVVHSVAEIANQPELESDVSKPVSAVKAENWKLWHRRMGHANYGTVMKLLDTATGVNFTKPKASERLPGEDACEPCLAGGMKESFNKTTDNRTDVKIRRLHTDLSGIKASSIRGYKYFLLVVDDATRYTWVALVKDKSAASILPVFKEIKSQVERESQNENLKVVFVRADNARGEFGIEFQAYLKEDGIQFEPSPAYKHSMNGVVERAMAEINEKITSMLYEAKASYTLWCFAAEHAVYLKNRLVTQALPFGQYLTETPYEAYYERKPNLQKLRVWGCVAFPLNLAGRTKSTYEPRIKDQEYAFVGMRGNHIWRLLNLRTLREEVYADVKFQEYQFHDLLDITDKFMVSRTSVPLPAIQSREAVILRSPQSQDDTVIVQPYREAVMADKTGQAEGSRRRRLTPPDDSSCGRTERRQLSSEITTGQAFSQPDDSCRGSRSRSRRLSSAGIEDPEAECSIEVDTDTARPRIGKGSVISPRNKPTRSGRVPKLTRKVFSDVVVQLVTELKAVHISREDSMSLGVPAVPFETVSEKETTKEDAPEWQKAKLSELQSLKSTNTYAIVNLPKGRKIIRSRWVHRRKFGSEGNLIRFKSRVVVKGFEEVLGLDYFETFASVVRYATLRALLAKAAEEDLEIHQLDVNTAFLNSPLEEEIYMEIPDHFEMIEPDIDRNTKCLRLLKALYGLKQAPRTWLSAVQTFFKSIGFRPSKADPNLFIRGDTYILLYVDDMLIVGDLASVIQAKSEIMAKWKCEDLGEAKLFVGFQIIRNRPAKSLQIHQTLYTTKLLHRFGMQNANSVSQPFPTGTVLLQNNLAEVEEEKGNSEYQKLDSDETEAYRQVVGSLLYLSNCTRFDISYAVGQLARFMQIPRIIHLRLAKQVLRYLRGTVAAGILFTDRTQDDLYTYYSDATWGSESDRISFQGWCVTRAGGAVLWTAKRQNSVALSSMEAEFMAASEASKEVAWLEKLNIDLNEGTSKIPTLYCDNQGAVELIHNTKFHNRAKHIDIRYHHIRDDMVQKGKLEVKHIPGLEQPADILTKQLPAQTVKNHIHNLGLRFDRLQH